MKLFSSYFNLVICLIQVIFPNEGLASCTTVIQQCPLKSHEDWGLQNFVSYWHIFQLLCIHSTPLEFFPNYSCLINMENESLQIDTYWRRLTFSAVSYPDSNCGLCSFNNEIDHGQFSLHFLSVKMTSNCSQAQTLLKIQLCQNYPRNQMLLDRVYSTQTVIKWCKGARIE